MGKGLAFEIDSVPQCDVDLLAGPKTVWVGSKSGRPPESNKYCIQDIGGPQQWSARARSKRQTLLWRNECDGEMAGGYIDMKIRWHCSRCMTRHGDDAGLK